MPRKHSSSIRLRVSLVPPLNVTLRGTEVEHFITQHLNDDRVIGLHLVPTLVTLKQRFFASQQHDLLLVEGFGQMNIVVDLFLAGLRTNDHSQTRETEPRAL